VWVEDASHPEGGSWQYDYAITNVEYTGMCSGTAALHYSFIHPHLHTRALHTDLTDRSCTEYTSMHRALQTCTDGLAHLHACALHMLSNIT
jgi:hypothetical protein